MNAKRSAARKAWWAKMTPQQRADFLAKREQKRREAMSSKWQRGQVR